MITVIETMCRENYAAHTGFDGTFHWKNKPGSTYIVFERMCDPKGPSQTTTPSLQDPKTKNVLTS